MTKPKMQLSLIPTLAMLALAFLMWYMPTPKGLEVQAWHMFIIFVITILSVIVKAMPTTTLTILGLAMCMVTKTLTVNQALIGFSKPTVWLVVSAFFIATAFVKTGLGKRMAYVFIAYFGKTKIGLSYGLIMVEFILSTLIPSNTARGGGVVYPIVQSIATGFNSHPKDESRYKIGAYLMLLCFQANTITSGIFMTALVGNPLSAQIAQGFGIELNLITWAKAAVIPGVACLLVLPLVLLKVCPPQINSTVQIATDTKKKLKDLGGLSFHEMILIITFISLIILWVFGKQIALHHTAAALIGVAFLLITDTITINDMLEARGAWKTFIWLSIFLMMATYIKDFGMIDWVASKISIYIKGMHYAWVMVILSLVYFFIHYLFASTTASNHLTLCHIFDGND